MGVNFSQAWANKSLCKVALSGRKRDYPVSQVLLVSFLPRMLWCMSICPHPSLRKVNGTVAAVVDRGKMGRNVGGNILGKWAFGPDAERPWTGCSPPPSPFSKQVPFKFAPSLHVHVEVQHQELGFLCAVTAAHRTNKFGIGGTDAPDHAAAASALQCDEVADKLARPKVPQLHRTIIGAGDDKILVELQACYCTLVLVGTWKQNKRNRS